MKICTLPDCERVVYCKGVCKPHHQRGLRKSTNFAPVRRYENQEPVCIIDNCGKPSHTQSMCSAHARRVKDSRPIDYMPDNKKWDACTHKTAHARCRALWGTADNYDCISCGNQAKHWAYDGTDPEQLFSDGQTVSCMFYSRYPEYYMPMCVRCHGKLDGAARKAELREYRLWKAAHPGMVLPT